MKNRKADLKYGMTAPLGDHTRNLFQADFDDYINDKMDS